MSIEEVIAAALIPQVREVIRAEVRAALAEVRPDSGEEYLSLKEASYVSKLSTKTLNKYIKEGKLPNHGAGRGKRIRRDLLKGLIENPPISSGDLTPEDVAAAVLKRGRR